MAGGLGIKGKGEEPGPGPTPNLSANMMHEPYGQDSSANLSASFPRQVNYDPVLAQLHRERIARSETRAKRSSQFLSPFAFSSRDAISNAINLGGVKM